MDDIKGKKNKIYILFVIIGDKLIIKIIKFTCDILNSYY